jgi:hypothetical protein
VADPTPFLSTITGASAGLVAIIGGLLVNRFVGIDSEQQGAQALLDQAEERLRIAGARAKEARQAWEAFEVAEFLDEPDVLQRIRVGVREAAELDPELLETTPLTLDQLRPHVQDAAEEFAEARELLDGMLKPAADLSPREWRTRVWESVRVGVKEELPIPRRPSVWEAAFDAVIEARAQERERQDAAKLPYGGVTLGSLADRILIPPISSVTSTLISNREVQRVEQQRARLTTEKERTEQHLEDAEVEAGRLRERRDAIVRPDAQLWIGIGVLLYPTIVGIVFPVLTMVGGPTAFTGWIRTLGVLFVTALVWLLGYMVYLATRLSRGRRRQ